MLLCFKPLVCFNIPPFSQFILFLLSFGHVLTLSLPSPPLFNFQWLHLFLSVPLFLIAFFSFASTIINTNPPFLNQISFRSISYIYCPTLYASPSLYPPKQQKETNLRKQTEALLYSLKNQRNAEENLLLIVKRGREKKQGDVPTRC